MHLSKRTVLLALGAILLLTLVLRYPLVEHERFQADSYYIHYLSESIVDYHQARWTFNPLSYTGYYPLSYPSGVPFLVSEFSILSGMSVETCILVFGMVLGVLFAIGVFVLAREFVSRPEFALLAVLIVSLGPRFVDTTYWVGSARGPLVVIMILGIATLVRFGSTGRRPLAAIGALFVLVCFTMHHMAVLLAVFGCAYLLSVFGSQYLSDRIGKRRVVVIGFYLSIVAVVFLGAFGFFDFFTDSIIRMFAVDDYVFRFDSDILTAVSNMTVSYAHQMGFALLFAAFYSVSIIGGKRIRARSAFLVVLLVSFVPLLGSALYLSMLLLPFVALLASLWFADVFRTEHNLCAKRICVVGFVAASLILPVWSTNWWNGNEYVTGDRVEIDSAVFNDMAYLNSVYEGRTGFTNSEILAAQFSATSGVYFMRTGVYSAISGDFTRDEMKEDVSWSDADFPVNLYLWFEFDKDSYVYYTVRGISLEGISYLNGTGVYNEFARDYFLEHQHVIVVLDNEWYGSFVGRWGIQPSELSQEMESAEWYLQDSDGTSAYPLNSYVAYRSERVTQYLLEIPL